MYVSYISNVCDSICKHLLTYTILSSSQWMSTIGYHLRFTDKKVEALRALST